MDELTPIQRHRDKAAAAKAEKEKWLPMWRELNEAFYPFLYSSLYGTTALEGMAVRNTKLLDGAPAEALFVLSAGFYNGVTSPARKWLNVKRPGNKPYEEPKREASVAHSQARAKILEVLAGTNYYDSRAVQVYDCAGMGTGVLLCYEDYDLVCRFTVCPPGSYALITNASNMVEGFVREVQMTATALLAEFGPEVLPPHIVDKGKKGGSAGRTQYLVTHIIEENENDGLISAKTPYREVYYLSGRSFDAPDYLAKRPLYEWPCAVFRWSCPDNSTYGIPPTVGCYGKAVQLQNLEYKSDQGLDKMISPPLLASHQLKNKPKAFSANGIVYTTDVSPNGGARPVYQLQVPFQELEIKRQRIVEAISTTLFNDLFRMVSQLDTVRSATEIDARREEKLAGLGPVLHRSYVEDIGVVVRRVYGICLRKGLLSPFAEGDGAEIEFSNILSDVQKASDVATLERFMTFVGQLVPVFPELQPKIDVMDVTTQYAEGLGVRPTVLASNEDAEAANAQAAQMAQLQQVASVAKDFGGAAQSLAGAEAGGGLAAVQSLL